MKYLWLAFVSLLASYSVAQSQFVYTNNNVITGTANSPNSVSAFLIAADGSLTQTSGSPFNTGGKGGGNNIDPEEIAIASRLASYSVAQSQFVYTNNNVITGTANSPNSVSAFLIAADGSLTQTSG